MHDRSTLLLVLVILLLITITAAGAQIQFSDVTAGAGLGTEVYYSQTGHSLGVAWVDVNVDGLPDIVATNGFDWPGDGIDGHRPHLYLNEGPNAVTGEYTFALRDDLLPAQVPNLEFVGVRYADYDKDGDPDLYLYTAHELWDLDLYDGGTPSNPNDGPPNFLLKNEFVENGGLVAPLFTSVAGDLLEDCPDQPFEPGPNDYPCYQTRTAAWLDYDRDGCVDLYAGHMVPNEVELPWSRDQMYRHLTNAQGECTGTWENATDATLIQPNSNSYRGSLTSIAADFDQDGFTDLYIGNAAQDREEPEVHFGDQLYNDITLLNTGFDTFTPHPDVLDDTPAAMGIDLGDVNLDGRPDVYITDVVDHRDITHDRGNTLYMNLGTGWSENITAATPAWKLQAFFSWGTNFFDADLDGDEDLFVGEAGTRGVDSPTGHGDYSELFENMGGNGMVESDVFAAFVDSAVRGSAVADYDRDGDLDILVVNQSVVEDENGDEILRGLKLFRNDTVTEGSYLRVRLDATSSNADAFGARVVVVVDGVAMERQLKGGVSTHSQDFGELHFGLGGTIANPPTIDSVTVHWPFDSAPQLVVPTPVPNSEIVVVEQ